MEPQEPPTDPRIDAVYNELFDVAGRAGVHRAFGERSKQGREVRGALPIPELRGMAERSFPQQWRENRWSVALELTLRRAIGELEGTFGGALKAGHRGIAMQEAALRFFNLDGSPSFPEVKPVDFDHVKFQNIGGPHYNKVLYELVEVAGLDRSKSSITRDIEDLRRRLAKSLIDVDARLVAADTSASAAAGGSLVVRQILSDEFIARPDYEQAIRQLRDAGGTHVWLWGDAGTGKTRLARAANRDRIAERAVPVLTPRNEQKLLDQYADLLIKSGVDPAGINSGNCRARFIAQLNDGRMPKVLVFDDMPPDRELIKALTSTQGSFLIFTSIERPPPPPEGYTGPELEIRNMTPAESEQMIRSRLLDAQDGEVHQINAMLAGRPLAIEHSCSFLRETGMSVADYCSALARQPATTLDAAGNPHGRTLTRVYEMIIEYLADRQENIRALDYIIFTDPNVITVEMLSFLWVDSLGIPSAEAAMELLRSTTSSYVASFVDIHRWPGATHPKISQIPYVDPAAAVTLNAALRRLGDFGLIRAEDGRIVMHQLTWAILGHLRRDHIADVYERVMDTAHALLLNDEWDPDEPLQGNMIPWALLVARAVAQFDAAEPGIFERFPVGDIKKLTLLVAMVLRAHLQMGISINSAVESVKNLYGIVALRSVYTGYDAEEREQLQPSYFGLHKVMQTILTPSEGFSRKLDGGLMPVREVTSLHRRIANGVRLEYDTEWELSHKLFNFEEAEATHSEQQPAKIRETADVSGLNASARTAMTMSRHYYDQCKWGAAIAALEHAYACYIKIGGDTGAIRGAIDAARRLARVHLRAGPAIPTPGSTPVSYLDTATEWLVQAEQVKWRRSGGIINGHPSRFRLYDRLLDAQLVQVGTQIELTRQLLVWEARVEDNEYDTDETDLLAQFVSEPYQYPNGQMSTYSRLEEAKQAISLLKQIRALRLVPEFRMHVVRLLLLAQDTRGREDLDNLRDWFTREDLRYQTDLLTVQGLTISAPGHAIMLALGGDANTFFDELGYGTDEVHNTIEAVQHNAIEIGDNYYTAAHAMSTHRNPYWHARGLAATLIIGLVTERERSWINAVRRELEQAATGIGRTDWIDMVENFGDTNGGLWLLGY